MSICPRRANQTPQWGRSHSSKRSSCLVCVSHWLLQQQQHQLAASDYCRKAKVLGARNRLASCFSSSRTTSRSRAAKICTWIWRAPQEERGGMCIFVPQSRLWHHAQCVVASVSAGGCENGLSASFVFCLGVQSVPLPSFAARVMCTCIALFAFALPHWPKNADNEEGIEWRAKKTTYKYNK